MDETPNAQTPSLTSVLAGQPVGTWVILDPGMTTILSTAQTPEEALRKAAIEPDSANGKRPVMVQVSDPSLTCFY